MSIVFDVYALRHLGAAREAAFFATAPFVGALLSIPILGESLRAADGAAGIMMGIGVLLLVGGADLW
jgi:drug/metabolite transporter (DMT)-like permease